MQLVEQHMIGRNHPFWQAIDMAAFASKNLYNAANYLLRQTYIHEGKILDMPELYAQVKEHEAYSGLPRKVSNDMLRQLLRDWKSFRMARIEFNKDPSNFLGRPKLPKYKDKETGRNILIYDIQAIGKPLLRINQVKLSGLPFILQSKQKGDSIDQVRIAPKKTHYVIEVVYTVPEKKADVDPSLYAGIDMGLDNLAVIASNKPGFTPLLVNGRPLKSINQYYNKRKAELQSILGSDMVRPAHQPATSKRIDRLTDKRNRKVNHYLHNASRRIIDTLVNERIGTLVIGKNAGWKQEIGIGKRNNQNFVSIPHARFVEMLTYKAELVGIQVIVTEESYTSKTSFLDNEPIKKHETYLGRRIMRGLFRTAKKRLINADLNGAYNIIKKVAPAAFRQGVEGVAVHPLPLQA